MDPKELLIEDYLRKDQLISEVYDDIAYGLQQVKKEMGDAATDLEVMRQALENGKKQVNALISHMEQQRAAGTGNQEITEAYLGLAAITLEKLEHMTPEEFMVIFNDLNNRAGRDLAKFNQPKQTLAEVINKVDQSEHPEAWRPLFAGGKGKRTYFTLGKQQLPKQGPTEDGKEKEAAQVSIHSIDDNATDFEANIQRSLHNEEFGKAFTVLAETYLEYGAYIRDYPNYGQYIEGIVTKEYGTNLKTTLEVLKSYIQEKNITQDKDTISASEKAVIKRFIKKTLKAETATDIPKQLNLSLELLANKDFIKMLQGSGTNALMKIKTAVTSEGQIDFMGAATFRTDKDFTLIINDYAALMNGIPTHAWKLFDCFMIVFTQTKNPSIRLSLKDYMAMRGLKDIKSARKQVLESMDALSKISYKAKERINGRWVYSGTVSLFGGTKIIKNGVIQFNFNTDFYEQLLNYKVMDYPPGVLTTNDTKNPNAFYFYRFIVENYRMNEGKDRLGFINVGTLMSKSPKMLSYEEVMNSNRNIKDRIIKPFIKDLDSLDDVYYDIVAEDKKTIIDNVEELTYKQFIKCYVKVDYTDYPKNVERIAHKRKHQEAARNRRLKTKDYTKGTPKKIN